ncbi:hypothetical protein VTK73DRAFT_6237 [Phialemonium thermophilum]|uniref:Uncharacterized protein n=1 Tax=Phialemonium thermophilum TaxID=223376 RepID=A0ABR3WKM9_9PEZI
MSLPCHDSPDLDDGRPDRFDRAPPRTNSLAWCARKVRNLAHRRPSEDPFDLHDLPRNLRPHEVLALEADVRSLRRQAGRLLSESAAKRRPIHRYHYRHRIRHAGCAPDAEEDFCAPTRRDTREKQRRAHSFRRPPSLERQEAFRDGSTAKRDRDGSRCSSAADATFTSTDGREAAEVAELYRRGLLYDDEHERGSGFGFDAIAHSEPLYRIAYRPIKQGRKRSAVEHKGRSLPSLLDLGLSYTALGDDQDLKPFLVPLDGPLSRRRSATSNVSAGAWTGTTGPSPLSNFCEPSGSSNTSNLHDSITSYDSNGSFSSEHCPTQSLTNATTQSSADFHFDSNTKREDYGLDDEMGVVADPDELLEWEVLPDAERHDDLVGHNKPQLPFLDASSSNPKTTHLIQHPDSWVMLGR